MTELILNNALQLPAVYPELTGGAKGRAFNNLKLSYLLDKEFGDNIKNIYSKKYYKDIAIKIILF